MSKHLLDEEIETENKENLKALAKSIIRISKSMIEKRNEWIARREVEKEVIKAILVRTYSAFENGNEEELRKAKDELEVLLNSTQYTSKRNKGKDCNFHDEHSH